MKSRVGILMMVAGLSALAPTSASAAKVSLKQIEIGPRAAARGGGNFVLVYQAGRGEANNVGIDGDGFTVRIGDKGATIKAGARCDRVTAHKAVCEFPMTRRLDVTHPARANLGNGDDRITGDGIFWNRLNGGTGDDRLRGSPSNDFMIGGKGSDLIGGRGGDGDIAVYQGRADDLRINLAKSARYNDGGKGDGPPGQRDRIVGVEDVAGGKGDDVLRGNNSQNTLIPLGGEDTVFALGGNDFIDLGLDAGGGGDPDQVADVADCGAGESDGVQGADGLDTLIDCE